MKRKDILPNEIFIHIKGNLELSKIRLNQKIESF